MSSRDGWTRVGTTIRPTRRRTAFWQARMRECRYSGEKTSNEHLNGGKNTMGDLTAGLDIDEKGKPTAIAVVERERRTFWNIWFLERLSALPYDDAMQRVVEITEEAARRNGGR